MIHATKPTIILEWYEDNLIPYGYRPESLLDIAAGMGYRVLSVPGLVPIDTPSLLRAHMVSAEAFMLIPA